MQNLLGTDTILKRCLVGMTTYVNRQSPPQISPSRERDDIESRQLQLTLVSSSSETSSKRGSLVFKATDSFQTYHDFEPSAAEDQPCGGDRCALNLLRLKHPPIGVVWNFGEGVPTQVSSSSSDYGSK
ncbi:hypothetical protein TNCV_21511 [Trichonephila clavipes]|nr:hypothetical protein TNCV_21511 [Trichonephila clavipes]